MIEIPRDQRGNRDFDEQAISRLRAIVYYRNIGLSIKEIKTLFADFHNHEKSLVVLKEHLADLKQKISYLQTTENYIIEKIELHELLLSMDKEGKSLEEQQCAYQSFLNRK